MEGYGYGGSRETAGVGLFTNDIHEVITDAPLNGNVVQYSTIKKWVG
jgi:hypothetical protein